MPWYKSTLALVLASILLPPAGLVILWVRSTGIFRKVFGTLVIGFIFIAQLFTIYGLRIEIDGGGVPRFFTFRDRAARDRAVETDRSARPPAVPTEPTPATTVEASSASAPHLVSNYWTDFRGPNRLSIYDEMPILTQWPKSGLKRLWKQPAGGGYSSFVIAGGLAYTIEQRRGQEAVVAYDIATGRERWTNSWDAHFQESLGGDGPRSTPVYDGGRIYALGAEGELRCLDSVTGKIIWNKNVLTENGATNLMWAQAWSPLIVDGKAIVLPGGPNGRSVAAYDKLTGKTVWASQNDEQSYTSPVVLTLAGKRQLVVVSALRAMGLAVEDGRLLWDYPWVTEYHINATEPIQVAPNRFFLSASYGHGAAVVELSPDGDKFKTRTVWQNTRMKNKFNSSVLFQGHLFGLDDGILACVNAETGDQTWKGGRYGYGQVLLASGHLVVLTEQGDLVLVRANPAKHEELARFSALEGKTWNHPAIAGGVLLVRNTSEMAAFRVTPE